MCENEYESLLTLLWSMAFSLLSVQTASTVERQHECGNLFGWPLPQGVACQSV